MPSSAFSVPHSSSLRPKLTHWSSFPFPLCPPYSRPPSFRSPRPAVLSAHHPRPPSSILSRHASRPSTLPSHSLPALPILLSPFVGEGSVCKSAVSCHVDLFFDLDTTRAIIWIVSHPIPSLGYATNLLICQLTPSRPITETTESRSMRKAETTVVSETPTPLERHCAGVSRRGRHAEWGHGFVSMGMRGAVGGTVLEAAKRQNIAEEDDRDKISMKLDDYEQMQGGTD
ncbi:hypothetical protein V8E53_014011 [Lactarius tabidus]